MEMGLWLPVDVIRALPPEAKSALITALMGAGRAPDQAADQHQADEDDAGLPDLTTGQASKFLETCGDKITTALRVIVGGGSRYFQIADVAKAVNSAPGDLAGVWAGITRRTRTILGDPGAYLIGWDAKPVLDTNGVYVDHRGQVTETTYRSFRRVLGIE
jgi:hypothetical protein